MKAVYIQLVEHVNPLNPMALAHAILAALADTACSGYDLAKQFDRSVGFFWKATFQQIYRELSKLEAQGWVEAEVVVQFSRPDKKLYRVTDVGRAELAKWVAEPGELATIREDLLVRLFAGHLVPSQVVLHELERHRQLHTAQLSAYCQLQQQFFSDPETLPLASLYQYLTLRKGIRYETDCIAWCEEATQLIRLTSHA